MNGLIKCNNNEQYSRRSCLLVHRIESIKSETIGDVLQKVKECYRSVQVPFMKENIQRARILSFERKQPLEVFCKKRCSLKFRKIHRKTPVSESLF